MALGAAVVLATLVFAAPASAQVPAYAPPAWFSEGLALAEQQDPAADCKAKYTGEAWAVNDRTCFFEERPVSGAVANGRCGAYVAPTATSYYCVIWYGALALHSCSRFLSAAPDAWRGGAFDPNKPFTPYAELADCLDAESPGPQDVAKLSGKRVQRAGSSVSVNVACTERCTARATGTLTIAGGKSFKLKPATATIDARANATLELAVPRAARKAARTALRANSQVRAKLAITGVDAVGTRRTKTRTVRLRL